MSRPSLVPLALALALSAATLSAQDKPAPPAGRSVYDDLQMFSQVLNQIRVNHADSVDVHELFMAAIQGMVRSVDPHSYVLVARKDATVREQQIKDGKLHPVPIGFELVSGNPLVVYVVPGSRAAGMDIIPGDVLVGIDGAPVQSETSEELEIELAGAKGSSVILAFERRRTDGSLAHLERKVKRERIEEMSAVVAPMLLDQRTGYLKIVTFMSGTIAQDVREALTSLEKRGMERLVLDLRDNGGGSVRQAALVAGDFLPTGTVIYTSEGRKADFTDTARAERSSRKQEKRYPMVVLVNDGTASAAELLAGALQDHDRALLVGTPTFGKSLIMRGFPLADGSAILLVVGRLRTPCGRLIQRPYRDITTHEYYRTAGMARDTTGLPSCKTEGGRTVYGGRGLFPDVLLAADEPRPLWLSRLFEDETLTLWVGGFVSEHRAALGTLESFESTPRLPADPIKDFRAFAKGRGVDLPETSEADDWIRSAIFVQMAWAAFGVEGLYRVAGRFDADVKAAVAAFDRAESLLK